MRIASGLPSIVLFVLVGVGWEAAVRLRNIPRFLLPAPSAIVARVLSDWPNLAQNAGATMLAAVSGFAAGTAAAVLLAVIFLYSRPLERALFPWVIVMKTIPILAIAPLLTIWLGFGIAPKIAVAAIACVFPTLVNVTRGLRSINRSILDIMIVLHTSPAKLFVHARLYAALPYLFSAMKFGSGLSVVGAVVAEFTGANRGIGTIIVNAGYRQDAVMLFSAIFVTSASTIILFYAVVLLERLVLFWPGADIDG